MVNPFSTHAESGRAGPEQKNAPPRLLNIVAIPLLRWSLGFVYVWFGLLKLAGVSPVADLVAKALSPLPARAAVLFVGALETVIGMGLMARKALKAILVLFFVQLSGTFTLIFRRPRDLFQKGNPLLLTQEGEFMLKNLVLLSGGLVVATRAGDSDERVDDEA